MLVSKATLPHGCTNGFARRPRFEVKESVELKHKGHHGELGFFLPNGCKDKDIITKYIGYEISWRQYRLLVALGIGDCVLEVGGHLINGLFDDEGGALINASYGGKSRPNARFCKKAVKGISVQGLKRLEVTVRATRPINPGSEVLMAYGEGFWRVHKIK